MSELEKNEEGQLTEAQANALMAQSAELLKTIIVKVGELSGEDLLKVRETKEVDNNEAIIKLVNECYQLVIDANLPRGFNEVLPEVAALVFRQIFVNISKKTEANEHAIVAHYLGKNYYDISVKDMVSHIEELETSK